MSQNTRPPAPTQDHHQYPKQNHMYNSHQYNSLANVTTGNIGELHRPDPQQAQYSGQGAPQMQYAHPNYQHQHQRLNVQPQGHSTSQSSQLSGSTSLSPQPSVPVAQQPLDIGAPTRNDVQPQLVPEERALLQRLQKFQHILHLPMFTPANTGQLSQFHEQRKALHEQSVAAARRDRPQLSLTESALLQVVGAATGTSFSNPMQQLENLSNAVTAMSLKQTDAIAQAQSVVTVTRWAPPPDSQGPKVIVDVFIYTSMQSSNAGMIFIKASEKVKIKLAGKKEGKAKPKSAWGTTEELPLKLISIIDKKSKKEHPLEEVLWVSRPLSALGGMESMQEFRKKWIPPKMP